MTKFTVDRKQALKFLGDFGDIADLRLTIWEEEGEALVAGTVGRYTHYQQLTIPCEVQSSGSMALSDVHKVCAFLKRGSEGTATFHQEAEAKTLYLSCGNLKIHFPGTSKVETHNHVGSIERLLEECAESQWTKWARADLTCSGELNGNAVQDIVNIHNVLGENPLYTVEFYPGESEMVVKAGRRSKGRMFVTLPVTNAKGPEHKCTAVFGANFPINLRSLPSGPLEVHMGEDAPIILRHEGSDTLLIVFDCDYEEGWE